MNRTIVWFRRDLRVCDHQPLYRAARRGEVIPVFIFDRALLHHPETGANRVVFMLDCLHHLDQDLRQLGGRLVLRSGDPIQVLLDLIRQTQAEGIYAHTDCERIYGRQRDARLNRALAAEKFKIRWFEPPASLEELVPYPVYRQAWYEAMAAPLVPTPERVVVPAIVATEPLPKLTDLDHRPTGVPIPTGGTQAARQLLQQFLAQKTDRYYWRLSYPAAVATSGLSPHLKFGVISIRECVQTTQTYPDAGDSRVQRSLQQFMARLRWGSGFSQRFRYLPQLELRSLYRVFDQEGWRFDADGYRAWQMGQTGFPIVDAAARCLQASGGYQALNFRSRAIYASFLSNLLGIDWRYGALHFMRHLIDGDCPIDHYQWAMQAGVTHCVDKTWTRIYNPGQVAVDRCDPEGEFIYRWLPELRTVPVEQLGNPPSISGYPAPILDYGAARQRRIQQLERQRQPFLQVTNIVPFLVPLPTDLTPFGADLYDCETEWTQSCSQDLFPPGLSLEQLSPAQAQDLRTWFVAHVNVVPTGSSRRSRASDCQIDTSVRQLSLLP